MYHYDMGKKWLSLALLGIGSGLLAIGLFGPSGALANKKRSDALKGIDERITSEYGKDAYDAIAREESRTQGADRARTDWENARPALLDGQPVGIRAAAAIAASSILFAAFAALMHTGARQKNGKPERKRMKNGKGDQTTQEEKSAIRRDCPLFDMDQKGDLVKLAKALKDGKLAAIPCDTIYGFCAKADDVNARRIRELKKSDRSKKLITLCDKETAKELLGSNCPKTAYRMWPAALSVIALDENGEKTCIRVPDNPALLALTREAGPLFSTSVNISGEQPINNLEDVISGFSRDVDAIAYSKRAGSDGKASSIIDVTSYPFRIVREGALDSETIRREFAEDGFEVI